MAHCLYACSARHTGTDWSRNYVSYPESGRVRRLVPIECERLQGFPENWTIPPEDSKFHTADDLDSLRYYALGNAVTVNVAQWLAGRIHSYLQRYPQPCDDLNCTVFPPKCSIFAATASRRC